MWLLYYCMISVREGTKMQDVPIALRIGFQDGGILTAPLLCGAKNKKLFFLPFYVVTTKQEAIKLSNMHE